MVASSSEFRTLFAAFDRDADGKISAAEMQLCMKATLGEDVSAEDAEALVASVDADGDGLLCEAEFVRLVQAEVEEEERYRGLKEAFGMYEMEGEGCITPLRREVVEYMLDVDSHMFSLRRSKANFYRITSLFSGVVAVGKWFGGICKWKNPVTTILVHVLFLILVCYPELILPTVFLYLVVIGLWNYRRRPRKPPHMDTVLSHAELAHPDELDEEFDTFPTSKTGDVVRMRYDRLRSVAGRVQTVVGDLATQGERAQSLLSWRDPRATAIFITLSLVVAVVLYVTPFQVVAVVMGLYLLRHPRFRSKQPSVPFNFCKRLPAKSDMLL